MDTKQRLSEFEAELKRLSDKRDALDRKIKGLVQVIEGLKLMSDETDHMGRLSDMLGSDELGLTEAVRNYFEHLATGPVFPVEIRDCLSAAGYDGGGPQSALLAIHSILSRMEKKGEIDPVERDGKTAYLWVSKLTRAIRERDAQERRRKSRAFFGESPADDVYTSGMRGSEKPKKRGAFGDRKPITEDT